MVRTLQPVIFIPSDQASAYREAFADGLWRALGDAMRWFRARLDRDVFQTRPIVEFVGAYPAADYFHETQNKAYAELKRTWDVGSDGVTYVCYGLWGEGPYQARGNVIGASGSHLVVQSSTSLTIYADGSFPGYTAREPWNNARAQTGALAHELGHTLGLPHTDEVEPARAAESLMYAWWGYPRVILTPRELGTVLATLES